MTIAGFAEVKLDDNLIIYNTAGGPGLLTKIAMVPSGDEVRNLCRTYPLGEWDLGQRKMLPADLAIFRNFFHARYGKFQGFRFCDWADYKDEGAGTVTLISGNNYQMYKDYVSGGVTARYVVTKPVTTSIAIQGSGVYTFDSTTGIITKVSGSAPTGWTGQFDKPVRFNIDKLKYEFISADIGPGQGVANVRQVYYFLHATPIIELHPL